MTELVLSPCDEACQAVCDRLNAGTTYTLDRPAEYRSVKVEPLEQITGMLVDVISGKGKTLNDRLDSSTASQSMTVWIRAKLDGNEDQRQDQINLLNLTVRLMYLQLTDWRSTDSRVQVWECDQVELANPTKAQLIQHGLFAATIVLRVEVAP